jgi:hypothetical protein
VAKKRKAPKPKAAVKLPPMGGGSLMQRMLKS